MSCLRRCGRTNLGLLRDNSPVNLERPLRADGRLDGHIVQGHVDGTGTIGEISEDGEALMVRIDLPERSLPDMWWRRGS